MNPVPFNVPFSPGSLGKRLKELSDGGSLPDFSELSHRVEQQMRTITGAKHALMTTSGTAALEMGALLCDLHPGDEVILPSYTFVSTANAFALRGAVPVFVDIRPDTLNIDETLIEEALTSKTKALVPVHYGGIAAEMDSIRALAGAKNLRIIEDAAHAMGSSYRGSHPGTLSDAGCISFDAGKNLHCYKGGVLLVNNENWVDRAYQLLEKGTNRRDFDLGTAAFYTWCDLGSNYSLGYLSLLFLEEQLIHLQEVTEKRRELWSRYQENLSPITQTKGIGIPVVPDSVTPNGHIFFLICRSHEERDALIRYLSEQGVTAAFHYVPLHRSPAGQRFGRFHGSDVHTTSVAERLVRLPLFHYLNLADVDRICSLIADFFSLL